MKLLIFLVVVVTLFIANAAETSLFAEPAPTGVLVSSATAGNSSDRLQALYETRLKYIERRTGIFRHDFYIQVSGSFTGMLVLLDCTDKAPVVIQASFFESKAAVEAFFGLVIDEGSEVKIPSPIILYWEAIRPKMGANTFVQNMILKEIPMFDRYSKMFMNDGCPWSGEYYKLLSCELVPILDMRSKPEPTASRNRRLELRLYPGMTIDELKKSLPYLPE